MLPAKTSRPLLIGGAPLLAVMLLAACIAMPEGTTVKDHHRRASDAIVAAERSLIAFRHDLHRHPELSMQEERTSRKIAEQLDALGFDVRTNVGGYGVVGVLYGDGPGASDGPTVAFRADMDAVRDYTDDPVPYASTAKGVRHNCGHDMHSAIGLGLAIGFAEIRDTLPGNVMLVFQPAEETGTGARSMLADGVFADLKPDAILAVHTYPLEVGELAVRPGGLLAGRAQFAISMTGMGDVADAAAQVSAALKAVSTISPDARLEQSPPDFIDVQLTPRTVDPVDGKIVVHGTVMSAGIEGRAYVREQITTAIDRLGLEDIDLDMSYLQTFEGVNNDPVVLSRTSQAITSLTPEVSIQTLDYVYPAFSEDFGSFQLEVPGVMYLLGVNNSKTGTVGFPHSPDYVADDAAIVVGSRAMLAAALSFMEGLETGG
ncbi:MAG: amidohydrolase [Pseudomonadota bacterium]